MSPPNPVGLSEQAQCPKLKYWCTAADAGRSLADGARHPLGGARAHVADGEQPGVARLEGQREAVLGCPAFVEVVGVEGTVCQDEAAVVELGAPEIHSEVGSAPMKEKRPVQGTSVVPDPSVIATARRSRSPTSPVIWASVRT